jgi:hypothetical protein
VDLLPVMNSEGLAVGASGFTSPLGPGTYTFVIGVQTAELDAFPTYQFDVMVVPEPSTFILAIVAFGMLWWRYKLLLWHQGRSTVMLSRRFASFQWTR